MLDPELIKVVFILFTAGVRVKAGIMPLQSWLPAAMRIDLNRRAS